MSSPRDGLSTPYRQTKEQCETVPPCPCLHGRPTFGPSCTEFVYPGCWDFDNGATSKFDANMTTTNYNFLAKSSQFVQGNRKLFTFFEKMLFSPLKVGF